MKKSLIPKYSSFTQDKHDDYNSISNSSILQDSCIIIIIIKKKIVMLYLSFVMNILKKINGTTTDWVEAVNSLCRLTSHYLLLSRVIL